MTGGLYGRPPDASHRVPSGERENLPATGLNAQPSIPEGGYEKQDVASQPFLAFPYRTLDSPA